MAKQVQLRRGTTAQHSAFTGALGEVTIDTDKKVVVVHDGSTAGGIPLAKQATVDTKVDKVISTDNAVVRFNGTTGEVQNSGVIIDDSGNVIAGSLTTTFTQNVSRGIYIEPVAPTADAEFRVNGGGSWFTSFSSNTSGAGYGGWRHIDSSGSIKNWVQTAGERETQFGTSGVERMRITSSGNLLVGTTTDNGVDKLQVNGSVINTTPINTLSSVKVSQNSFREFYMSGQWLQIVLNVQSSSHDAGHIIDFECMLLGFNGGATRKTKGTLFVEGMNSVNTNCMSVSYESKGTNGWFYGYSPFAIYRANSFVGDTLTFYINTGSSPYSEIISKFVYVQRAETTSSIAAFTSLGSSAPSLTGFTQMTSI